MKVSSNLVESIISYNVSLFHGDKPISQFYTDHKLVITKSPTVSFVGYKFQIPKDLEEFNRIFPDYFKKSDRVTKYLVEQFYEIFDVLEAPPTFSIFAVEPYDSEDPRLLIHKEDNIDLIKETSFTKYRVIRETSDIWSIEKEVGEIFQLWVHMFSICVGDEGLFDIRP